MHQIPILHSALLPCHMTRFIVRDPWSLINTVPRSLTQCEDLPVQQQQTHPPNPTYPPYQQISEARYHSDSYIGASPVSGSPDPRHPPPLNVPGDGRWQGQSYYTSYSDLQIPPSSDLRSPHSVYSPASSFVQYQSPAGSAHPTEHSPSRGAVHTITAASTQCQQAMGISHASSECTASSSRGPTQLPYPRVLTASSPVPHDLPPETSDPKIKKKRKRADARQLSALNEMYARTAFPSTEDRQQLAKDLDMSARSVQIWLAHTFLYTMYKCLNYRIFSQVQKQKAGEPST